MDTTDRIALAALALSAISFGWQVWNYCSGAKTTLFVPDQVFIFRAAAADKHDRVHLVMNFAYYNSGAQGYDDVVRRESVKLRIRGKDHDYGWDGFGSVTGKFPNLAFARVAQSLPFVVQGGGGVSHQTRMVPWPVDCSTRASCDPQENHVLWEDFINELRALTNRRERYFVFDLVAYLGRNRARDVRCRMEISDAIIAVIDKTGQYNPNCFAVTAPQP